MIRLIRFAPPLLSISIAAVLLLGLAGCTENTPVTAAEVPSSELRGVWVQGRSIATREGIDKVLKRAETGQFNAIFVGVFNYGRTMYPSRLTDQSDKVEPGFDPLAYLVPEAHRRHIQVQAWFAVGRIGDETGSPILSRHPDWGLVGPDGETIPWLNFARPEARQFSSYLMLEVVERYGVDGVHLDYTRYPGPEWGFDAYSTTAFAQQTGLDLNQLRYADLPAYGQFEANPLINPSTAQVLATFANGLPAVTLNAYGQGEVIVLNWNASQRTVAVGAEILQRSLKRWLSPSGQVYVLHSETNSAEYGDDKFTLGMKWLQHLGWEPVMATENDVQGLGADSVLVMPNVYIISRETASHLADFVRRGGGIIFIDGPSRSIKLVDIQAITGLTARGKYFNEWTLITATGEHPLIPSSQRSSDLGAYQRRDAQWKEFRMAGVDALIRDVYQLVKTRHPGVLISVTITSDQEKAAQVVLQDWPAWLKGGYVDLLIPRAYVDDVQALPPVLTAWRPAIQAYGRITLGLSDYISDGAADIPKAPAQLLAEVQMAKDAGSSGLMIFDLDRMSAEQLQVLSSASTSSRAP